MKAGLLGNFCLFVCYIDFKEKKNYDNCLKRVFNNILESEKKQNLDVMLKVAVSRSCFSHCKAVFLLQPTLDPVILSFYFFRTKASFHENFSRHSLPLFS